MNCPKCASEDLRPSGRRRPADVFHALLGRRALRCRQCRLRFYGRPPHHKMRPEVRDRLVRHYLVEAAIFAVLLVLFLIFLGYLIHEPA